MKIGYMCSIDYDYHLENDYHGVPVYSSAKSIRHHRKCVKGKKSCGILKVRIKIIKIIKQEKI
jgi:hypothetical protein